MRVLTGDNHAAGRAASPSLWIGEPGENRILGSDVDQYAAWPFGGSVVLSFEAVEEVCESKQTTLVIHPAIRRAIKGYKESF
jgi:hypothetical protein